MAEQDRLQHVFRDGGTVNCDERGGFARGIGVDEFAQNLFARTGGAVHENGHIGFRDARGHIHQLARGPVTGNHTAKRRGHHIDQRQQPTVAQRCRAPIGQCKPRQASAHLLREERGVCAFFDDHNGLGADAAGGIQNGLMADGGFVFGRTHKHRGFFGGQVFGHKRGYATAGQKVLQRIPDIKAGRDNRNLAHSHPHSC